MQDKDHGQMLSSDLFLGIYGVDTSVCDLYFHFLNSVFYREEIIFMKPQFITSSLYVVFVVSISKNFLPNAMLQNCL